jgi:hypothetical protein
MVSKKYTLPELVEVFWWDHYSIGDDWYHKGFKHEPCILSAIGYLVDQDDHYYYVTSTYEISNGNYSSGTAVLKNCVTQMNHLRKEHDVNWDGTDHKTDTSRRRKV